MIADCQVGLGQPCLTDGPQDQKGQFVYGISAIRGLSADRNILVHGASGTGKRVRLGADLVDGQRLDPEVSEKLHGLFLCYPSLFQVGCQIGIDILIKAAIAEGVSVGLDLQDQLDEPDGLHGFVESLCRLIRHLAADAGDFEKFGSPGAFCRCCLPAGQRREALRESLHSINHDQDSLVELVLVDGGRLCQIQFCLQLPGTVFIAFEAGPEHAGVVHCKMRVTGVEFAFHAKEPRIHIDLHLFGDQGLSAGPQVIVLPERGDLLQLPFGLFRNIENIAVTLFKQIQLVQDELHRIFREDRRAAVHRRLIADQDRLVFNIDIHLCQNILQHQRPLHDRRLMQILFIGFCSQDSTLCVDIRFLVQDALTIRLHSGRQGSEMRFVFHLASPLFLLKFIFVLFVA